MAKKKELHRATRALYLIILLTLFFSSCKTYKKYSYLRDIPITGHDQQFRKLKPTYEIQPGDILYVRVITPDQTMGDIFNPFTGSNRSSSNMGMETMYYYGYTVGKNGHIEIPVIDSVNVVGATLAEAKKRIEIKARHYLKDPQVIVKMAQFKFTLLGEVPTPGVKIVYDNSINLIEAVSYGGGVTYNGDRTSVLILRSTENGTKTFQVDLTDKEIVQSDLYYIMPNDIIYVRPRRSTAIREETQNFLFGLSALSSTITALLLVMNLNL